MANAGERHHGNSVQHKSWADQSLEGRASLLSVLLHGPAEPETADMSQYRLVHVPNFNLSSPFPKGKKGDSNMLNSTVACSFISRQNWSSWAVMVHQKVLLSDFFYREISIEIKASGWKTKYMYVASSPRGQVSLRHFWLKSINL